MKNLLDKKSEDRGGPMTLQKKEKSRAIYLHRRYAPVKIRQGGTATKMLFKNIIVTLRRGILAPVFLALSFPDIEDGPQSPPAKPPPSRHVPRRAQRELDHRVDLLGAVAGRDPGERHRLLGQPPSAEESGGGEES